jgi:hypothetical protein
MKSIKTNPNSAKGPDKENIENNELHVRFFSKKI